MSFDPRYACGFALFSRLRPKCDTLRITELRKVTKGIYINLRGLILRRYKPS